MQHLWVETLLHVDCKACIPLRFCLQFLVLVCYCLFVCYLPVQANNMLTSCQCVWHYMNIRRFILWIYCPGHAGRYRLASTAHTTAGLPQLGRAEVLRGLRSFLTQGRQDHHNSDHQIIREVEKKSGWSFTVWRHRHSRFNQTSIGKVSKELWQDCRETGQYAYWPFWILQVLCRNEGSCTGATKYKPRPGPELHLHPWVNRFIHSSIILSFYTLT